jgi:hypothetical protein
MWRRVLASYDLEPHHLALLAVALEAHDRMRQAQQALAADGPFVIGAAGPRAHPGIAVERDSRIAFTRCIRELGLDLEAPAAPRPPSRWRA